MARHSRPMVSTFMWTTAKKKIFACTTSRRLEILQTAGFSVTKRGNRTTVSPTESKSTSKETSLLREPREFGFGMRKGTISGQSSCLNSPPIWLGETRITTRCISPPQRLYIACAQRSGNLYRTRCTDGATTKCPAHDRGVTYLLLSFVLSTLFLSGTAFFSVQFDEARVHADHGLQLAQSGDLQGAE